MAEDTPEWFNTSRWHQCTGCGEVNEFAFGDMTPHTFLDCLRSLARRLDSEIDDRRQGDSNG